MIKKLAAIFFLALAVNAQTIRNVPETYTTIASAVDNANAGDIIKIGPGTFAEQIKIQKNLTIIGSGKNSTLIRESADIPDSTAIFISGCSVTIRDIQINGFENTDGRRRGIVSVNSNLTIKQCNFVMLSNVALAVVNGSLDADSLLISCVNSGSSTAIVDSGQYGQGIGIYLDNGIMLMNAHFNINHLTGGASINHIIDIYPNSNNYILNTKYPVDLNQFTQGTIENSTLYGELDFAYGQAIRVFGDLARPEGAAQIVIRNNRIKGLAVDSSLVIPNRWDCAGICFSGANGFAEIYGNSIQYFNSGISLYGYSTANIHDNVITNNARYGVITSWGGGTYSGAVDLGGGIYDSPGRNDICNNGKYDVLNNNSLQVWALHNNWGSTDISAIGTKIHDHFDNAALGTVTFDINTFPVELISFSARPGEASVIISWKTATEINCYGFDIERRPYSKINKIHNPGFSAGAPSTAEETEWEKIGFVPGHGNSNSLKEYSFTDENPPVGEIEYRLKQIDIDGKYKYYAAVTISADSPKGCRLLQNSPNPFNPFTAIKFQLSKKSLATIRIYDGTGREVTTLLNDEREAGTHLLYWNGKDSNGNTVSSGTYFYRIQAESFSDTKKMVILK